MMWIEALAAAVEFLLKGIFFLVLVGVAGLIFIVLREAGWYVRQQNKRKLEEKQEEEDK